MNDGKLTPPQTADIKEKPKKDKLEPVIGEIGKIIGSGENAQHSIVYKTIVWCFSVGALFSVMFFCYLAYKNSDGILDTIKGIWSIFIPVITLSLGYIFGKSTK